MPAYATVGWQADDDISSQKLQQMADNEEYLKNQLVNVTENYGASTWNSYTNTQGASQLLLQAGFVHVSTDGAGVAHIAYTNPFPTTSLTVVATMSSEYAIGGYCNVVDLPTVYEGTANPPDANGFYACFYTFRDAVGPGQWNRFINANVTINYIAIGF